MKKITTSLILAYTAFASLSAQTKVGVNATRMQADPAVTAGTETRAAISSPAVSTLAISGYYQEGFESTTFPPTDWQRISSLGTNQWARSTAQAHSGAASAYMQYQTTGGLDWLIMPKFAVAATDSIVFWMRLAFVGYPPDSLSLKISTTDSATTSFNTTLLGLREGVNYPPNSTTWYRYAVSLSAYAGQQVFIAFKHYNNDGDGLYIDDVKLGTLPAAEVKTSAILTSANTGAGVITPQATVANNGGAAQTFNVTTTITPGGYTSTQTVTALNPSATTTLSFAPWTATPGTYTIKTYTQLAGDANLLNDTLTKSVNVLNAFTNYGWSSQTALAGGRWATAPVFSKSCVSGTDTGYVYLVSGGDASFANSTLTSAYNITTGTWTNKAPIPASRTQITPMQINNKIYVIGGYGGSFAPVTTNSIYDIAANTWTTGAPIPNATGDYACGVYNDSLIYIIGGYNGSGDINLVQVYNVNTNTWAAATPKPGTAVAGGRANITGNKIVHVGGYSQTLATGLPTAQMGTIDPLNPLVITWSTLSDYPTGNSSRLASGVTAQPNGLVYFGGGDPTGQGTAALNQIYAYNTIAGQWETGPAMLTGASNISSFAGVIKQDTLYLVTTGGYDGTAVTTANQWLKIGPATVPAIQPDVAICPGASAVLTASNGTAYSWSPASGLSSATAATVTATPAATTTYTVDISQKYGCPVPKNVTVTVNPLQAADAGMPATVCNGTGTMISATGGNSYSWSPSAGLSSDVVPAPTATPSSTTNYTVTVTDLNGCVNTDSVLITVNPLPAADAGMPVAVCEGDSVMLMASGGTAYSWSPAAGLGDAATAMTNASPAASTTYTVTVTDVNGCVNTDSVMLTVNTLPVMLAGSSNISCNGMADGSAGVSVSGSGTYNYLWSTSETTSSVSGLAAGAYSVTVTDSATGCSSGTGFTIVEPTALSVTTMDDTTAICDGTVMATVTGGVFSYTYLWAPGGEIIDAPTGLCPGTYTVTVTDANGCTATSTATVQSSVSITEEAVSAFSTYPNPASENITITGIVSAHTSICVMNVLGEKVMNITENANGALNMNVTISALSPGVYFLQFKNGSAVTSKRIVKK